MGRSEEEKGLRIAYRVLSAEYSALHCRALLLYPRMRRWLVLYGLDNRSRTAVEGAQRGTGQQVHPASPPGAVGVYGKPAEPLHRAEAGTSHQTYAAQDEDRSHSDFY